MRPKIIAVTGGIGAGKSVVCRILTCLGFSVYDCDENARRIMDDNSEIKDRLRNEITPDAVDLDGHINRRAISEVVFIDNDKLENLNNIVHSAVRSDLLKWIGQKKEMSFVETAILYQSGIDKIVDEVWEVIAPENIRISRVCRRNHLAPEEVVRRINSQNTKIIDRHRNIKTIVNDGTHSLLLQIDKLLSS